MVKQENLYRQKLLESEENFFLKKYNKKNGWYVNWASLAEENEIYALVVEGSVDIQGLVAVAPDKDMRAMYIAWMCTSPDNNKLLSQMQRK